MLCLSALSVLPCSPLEQIDAARAAGFDGVDLRLVPGMAGDVDVMADAALRRAIERRLAQTRLRVGVVEVLRVGPDTDVAAAASALRFAGDIGAHGMVVTTLPPGEGLRPDVAGTARRLADLADITARHGLLVLVEFMVYRGVVPSLDAAVRLLAQAGHPALRICLDALHLHRSGGTPQAVSAVDAALLGCLQLCDAARDAPADLADEARYDRRYPGEGQLPLLELLQAVPADLPIGVEVPSRAHAAWSVADRAAKAARTARAVIERARPPGRARCGAG